MTEIIVSIISGALTLCGVIVTVVCGNKLMLYRIEQLEKKQDKHNTLIERMYKAEDRLDVIDEKIKVANHRIEDIEHREAV